MHRIKGVSEYIFNRWGFSGLKDYFLTVFGLKFGVLVDLKMASAVVGAVVAFLAEWVWTPPLVIALFWFMNFVNGWYGYQISKKIKFEPFSWNKFNRVFSVCLSDMLIMSMIRVAMNIYPSYTILADLLFGWFFGDKIRSIIYKHVKLELQSEGLRGIMIKFFQTKIGKEYMDEVAPEPTKEKIRIKLPNKENKN